MKIKIIHIYLILLIVGFINIVHADTASNLSNIVEFDLNGGKILPSDYTLLEYLENNEIQYIDSGIPVSNTTEITSIISVLNVEVNSTNEEYASENDFNLFGSYGNWNGLAFAVRLGSFRFWASSQKIVEESYIEEVPYKITLNKNSKFLINDSVYYENSTVKPLDTTMLIFTARHTSSTNGLKNGSMRLYQMLIKEDNKVISYLLPAKNKDGELGLYDLIRNIFLTNSGSGSFTAGKESENKITYVDNTTLEYIPIPNKPYNSFLGWYLDEEYQKTVDESTSIKDLNNNTIYAKWQEHPHTYNELGVSNNTIGKICECGKIDTTQVLYFNISNEIKYTGKEIKLNLTNTLNADKNQIDIKYQKKDEKNNYIDIDYIPKDVGEYKIILTYENNILTKEIKIISDIKNPDTSEVFNIICILIISFITFIIILTTNYHYKKNFV